MSTNVEYMNVEMKVEKIEPEDEFIVEKFVIANSVFENENVTVEELLIEEPIIKRERDYGNINVYEMDEKKRKSTVDKMLSKNYTPRQIIISKTPKLHSKFSNQNWLSYISQQKRKSKSSDNPNSECAHQKKKIKNDVTNDDITYSLIATPENRVKLFQSIYNGTASPPKFPGKAWGFHRLEINGRRSLIYTELGMFNHQSIVPQVRKLVTFDENLNAAVYIYDKIVIRKEVYRKMSTLMHGIEIFLRQVNGYSICSGGPSALKYACLNPTYAVKDSSNVLRAKKCKIIIPENKANKSICDDCLQLEQTLEHHMELLQ